MTTNKHEDRINDLINIFETMVDLSEDEQNAYNEILDNLFEDTGITLFDLLD